MNRFRMFLNVIVVAASLHGCSSPGEYARDILESENIATIRDITGDYGAGLYSDESDITVNEDPRSSWYRIRARLKASHQTFGGQVLLPPGIQRTGGITPQPQPGGTHGR